MEEFNVKFTPNELADTKNEKLAEYNISNPIIKNLT